MLSYHLSYFNLLAIFGFTNASYTANEGIGTLQIDVRVLNVPDEQLLPASVELVIQSVSGSASKYTKPLQCISKY